MIEAAGPSPMCPLTLSRHRHAALIASLAASATPLARSSHFAVYTLSAEPLAQDASDVVIVHDFAEAQIDNNLGAYVADELLPLISPWRRAQPADGYAYSEHETFERCVGAIVRSTDGNEQRAWHRFYDNTLTGLKRAPNTGLAQDSTDFIAEFRALYQRIAELVTEVDAQRMLDVATCFGFLPLYLGERHAHRSSGPTRITGSDLNPALVELAEGYRQRRFIPEVNFVVADLLSDEGRHRLAADEGYFDVVSAIHLLEHLTAEETSRAVDQLWALTGRRLILAVPLEATPDRRFGHKQAFDLARLQALAARTTGNCHSFEFHGGWLVIDRNHHPRLERKRLP